MSISFCGNGKNIYFRQIIKGDNSGTRVELDAAVASLYSESGVKISDLTGTDKVEDEDVSWDETFGDWKKTRTRNTNLSSEGTDLVYTVTHEYGAKEYTSQSEGLKELNQYVSEKEKHFNASSVGETHTITEDLGVTSGKISIDGKGGTLDFAGHKGFEMASGTSVSLNDVVVANADNLAIIENGATLNLANVTMKNNGVLQNSGTINLSGNNSIDSVIAGMGDEASLNVNSDWEMDTAVTGHTVNVNGVKLRVGADNLDASDSLNVSQGSSVEISANKLKLDKVTFASGSELNLKISSLNRYGAISAQNITVEKGAQLKATLAQGIGTGKIRLLQADNEGFNNFAESFNNMYVLEKADKNGNYNISLVRTAEEVSREAGGTMANQKAAAAWVDGAKFSGGTSAKVADSLADLAQNDAKGLNEALTALAPNEASDVETETTDFTDELLLTMGKYLSNQEISGLSSGDVLGDVTLWAKGYYNENKHTAHKNAKGFDGKNKGVIAGMDKKLNSAVKIGAGFQYNAGDVKGYHRDAEVDTLIGFVYGEYRPSKWFISGVTSYGRSDYDEDKYALGLKIRGNYSADVYSAQVMTGYDFKYVTPELGLRYYRIKRHGYEDSIGQSVSGKNMDLLRGVAGLRMSHEFGIFKPELYAGVTHEFVCNREYAVVSLPNGSSYAVSGKRLARFGTELDGSITARVTDKASVTLGYEGRYRSHYQSHAGIVNVKYEF